MVKVMTSDLHCVSHHKTMSSSCTFVLKALSRAKQRLEMNLMFILINTLTHVKLIVKGSQTWQTLRLRGILLPGPVEMTLVTLRPQGICRPRPMDAEASYAQVQPAVRWTMHCCYTHTHIHMCTHTHTHSETRV